MEIVVMKFGGAALATAAHFSRVADLIIEKSQETQVVVVVSAMQGETDRLLSLAKEIHQNPSLREQDMLISAGERVSMALLAMALSSKGKEAISFTGSQSGILTTDSHSEAEIVEVKPTRIQQALSEGKVVIVAGFQGVSSKKEITTLGRGGSDTTAVALGVALKARQVEFYKDVKGVYSADPKTSQEAMFYPELSYDKLLEIIDKGAKVLHSQCVRLARAHSLPLRVISFEESGAGGTWIVKNLNLDASDE